MAISNFSKCFVMVLSLLCNTDKYADLCLDVNMLDGDIIFVLLMEVEVAVAVVDDPYSGPAAIPSLFTGVIPGSALPSPLVRFCSNALPASMLVIVAVTTSSPLVTPMERVRFCWSEIGDRSITASVVVRWGGAVVCLLLLLYCCIGASTKEIIIILYYNKKKLFCYFSYLL